MGATFSTSDRIMPSELTEVDSYQRSNSESSDTFKCKNRTTTDICFLLFYAIFLTVLVIFLAYCMFYGDIYRIINGYDNCGDICGTNRNIAKRNTDSRMQECYKTIHTSGPYHIVLRNSSSKVKDRLCVSNCTEFEGYHPFFTRCIPSKSKAVVNTFFSKTGLKNFFSEVSEDFHYCWREILYLCLISLGLSLLILILFRYLVGLVVWIVLIGAVLASLAGTVFLWIMWKRSKEDNDTMPSSMLPDIDARKTEMYLSFAILATVTTFGVVTTIIAMRKRIKLVVRLFEEAGKAIAVMPILLIEPILTFLSLGLVIFSWFYFSLWIESSGILTEQRPNVYYYEKNGWMKFTRWYNFFAMLWMTQFVIGCQHTVIAGAVSVWYFTRDKKKLNSPVIQSAYNLTRYHLGSVALGSFLIATVQFARVILKLTEKSLKNREGKCVRCMLKCCQCCLYCFEKILRYLTRNAYIEVAIYGYSFCKAGQQAFKLLSSNVLRVAAINSVGDFVLFLGKVVVVTAAVLIGIEVLQNKDGIHHIWVPVTLIGLFAYFISHCFMCVYEMAIDTIFLCFCEDCERNDGISKPYYMSRGLMEFVENSKKVLEVHDDRNRNGNAWQEISTVSRAVNTRDA